VLEPTRGSGILNVLGGLLAVLIAFVIFSALQTHRDASDSAGQEAVATTQLYRTTALFPEDVGAPLRDQLVCYSRAVVNDEWDARAMSPVVQGWLDDMTATLARYQPETGREQVAYGQWFTQDADRRDGRRARIAGAVSAIPGFLWFVLVLGTSLVIAFAIVLSDPRDALPIQLSMAGTVTAMLVCALSTIAFLGSPFSGPGGIRPVEMHRTLDLMQITTTPHVDLALVPCDSDGRDTES
jgi:hypothetical protein